MTEDVRPGGRGCAVLAALILPAVVLECILVVAAFSLSARSCLDWVNDLMVITALGTAPLLYFVADRRTTRGHVGSVIVRTLVVAVACLIPIAVAAPSMLSAPQRSRQKETMQRMRQISKALDTFAESHNRYPVVHDVAGLRRALGTELPERDGWCHPFAINSGEKHYEIISYGSDGRADIPRGQDYVAGATDRFEDDIVLRDGFLFRFPEGVPH